MGFRIGSPGGTGRLAARLGPDAPATTDVGAQGLLALGRFGQHGAQ